MYYTIKTLDDEKVATATIDVNSGKATDIKYYEDEEETALIQKNTANAGYWDRVQDCIENSWKTLPDWVKWICGSACGGCVFANPYACGGCAGCLAGYGIGCSLSQI
jgi:hypothetical protein